MNSRCETFEPLHSAWVDGELSAHERARLGAHLQRCARCRTAIAELRVTQTMLRSLPARNLVVDVTAEGDRDAQPRRTGTWRRALARSTAAVVFLIAGLGAAAFAAGSPPSPEFGGASVPVDVYVADHLVRSVGGPVSTPALFEPSR